MGYVRKRYLLGRDSFHDGSLGYVPQGKDGRGYILVDGFGVPFCHDSVDWYDTKYWFGSVGNSFETVLGDPFMEFCRKSADCDKMLCGFRFYPAFGMGSDCDVCFDYESGMFQTRRLSGQATSCWLKLIPQSQIAKGMFLYG